MFVEPILADIVRNLDDVPTIFQDEGFDNLMKNKTGNVTMFVPPKTSSLAVGVVFSAKPFMELLTNPIIGIIVDK